MAKVNRSNNLILKGLTLKFVVCFVLGLASWGNWKSCVCVREREIVTLLNLTLFTYNFYAGLIVMFCLFIDVLFEWNITKKNSCVQLHVIGE